PNYHGSLVAIWAAVPALLILGLWALFGDAASRAFIISQLPPEVANLSGPELSQAIARVRQIASGFGVVGEPLPHEVSSGQALRQFHLLAFALVIAAAAGTGALALYTARKRI